MRYSPATTGFPSGLQQAPRPLFVVAVLLGHAFVFYILLDRYVTPRNSAEPDINSAPIYVLPLAERAKPTAEPRPRSEPSGVKNHRTRKGTANLAPADPMVPDVTSASAVPTEQGQQPLVDWEKEAREAAVRAVQSEGKDQQFVAEDESLIRPKMAEPPRKDERRRAGLIEMVGPGIERRWVSERCFWEFGRPPPLLAGPAPRVNQLHCLVGPAEPDGHLFDELKPRYLKRKE